MKIFPAIDLYDGKAVRLLRGRYEDMTVYSHQPESIVRDFVNKGAQCLLVVVETRGGVLAVERVQCLRHIFLVHGESGLQEYV